jgi:hypothetical protein
MLERHHIEGRSAELIAEKDAFNSIANTVKYKFKTTFRRGFFFLLGMVIVFVFKTKLSL